MFFFFFNIKCDVMKCDENEPECWRYSLEKSSLLLFSVMGISGDKGLPSIWC